MTMPAIRQATPTEAQQITAQIRATADGLWAQVAVAYQSHCDAALGYASWNDYCATEFGGLVIGLPREERQEAVRSLREAGLSQRAIAVVTNQSQANVRNDLAGEHFSRENYSPDTQPVTGNGQTVLGLDGRVYPVPQQQQPYPPRLQQPPAPQPAPDPPSQPPRPAPVLITLRTHDGREFTYPKPQARATFNETTGEGISWAAWSWNPVTGCLHGCDYCYARAITHRWADAYPAGFAPLFHHAPKQGYTRLDAPANTTIPGKHNDPDHVSCGRGDCHICAYRRVFVCSMADLYGRWVPDEWIAQVHESMLASPQWEYLLLTKFPGRYPGLTLPPAAWVGTSVDEQKRVRIAEDAFRQVSGVKVKWLSLEPLREPLEFTDLSMFDWVVIGAQTATDQPDGRVAGFVPPKEWVLRITAQAKEAGCAVHWKPNLGQSVWYDEYPGSR